MVVEVKTKETPKGALKIEYEPEVDILTIYLRDPEARLSHSEEAEPGIVLNYGEDGSLSSVEVLDASKRYSSGQLAAHSVDELIDLKTASKLAGIAPVTLRTQAQKRRLWAMRLGGQWVTTRERLQQYVDSRSRGARTGKRSVGLKSGTVYQPPVHSSAAAAVREGSGSPVYRQSQRAEADS